MAQLDELIARLNELKNKAGRPTSEAKREMWKLGEEIDRRKAQNQAKYDKMTKEFETMLNKKVANEMKVDAKLARMGEISRPVFRRQPTLEELASGTSGVGYTPAGSNRMIATQYGVTPNVPRQVMTQNGQPMSAQMDMINKLYRPTNIQYNQPEAVPFIKKDPVSVTGTTAGDKAANDAIKAEAKAIEAAAKAEQKTGGLFSKMKGQFSSASGILKGGLAGVGGSAIGEWFDEKVLGGDGDIGATVGALAGAAATPVPYLGMGLAALGAGRLAAWAMSDEATTQTQQQEQQPVQIVQPEDSELMQVLKALASTNAAVANQQEGYKNRLMARAAALAELDPEILK